MQKTLIAAALAVAAVLMPLGSDAPRAQGTTAPLAARVIVKYRASAPGWATTQAVSGTERRATMMESLGQRVGVGLSSASVISERAHVVVATGIDSATLAARLAAQGDVEYAVPDEIVRRHSAPNDPRYASVPYNVPTAPTSGGPPTGQWYLKPAAATPAAAATANSAVAAINAEQAWDITTGSSSVVVAVIDTGVRFDHPDFLRVSAGGNLLDGYDMISDDNTGNDGQPGRDADASDPGDGVTTAEVTTVGGPFYHCTTPSSGGTYVGENSSWHGTQTASLVGAQTNNSIGMASVGRNVQVLPIRALGKCGRGLSSDVMASILWAAGIAVPGVPINTHKAQVINLSLGSQNTCSAAYLDTINQVVAAGVTVVASAGNEGMAVDSPANCAGVIGVAGLRNDGDKGGISSLGPEVALSAPSAKLPGLGQRLLYPFLAAYNAGTIAPVAGGTYTDSFVVYQGTSFSSPLVAGAAGLMLSVQPTLSPSDIKAKLQSSARAFPTANSSAPQPEGICTAPTATAQSYCYCTTTTCGAGMLDVHAAVLAAAASALQARASITTTAPTAGQPVTLSASGSLFAAGHAVNSYQWTLVDGGGIVTGFIGATNGPTVSLQPSAAGSFTVRLTVGDDLGNASSATTMVVVAAAPVVVVTPPPATTTSSSGGGGGGALGVGWLALLLSAVLALALESRRERRLSRREAGSRKG